MPKFQQLSCRIALSGDLGNTVVRSAFDPITYPELIILGVIHGETSITHILDCGETEDILRSEEYRRLADTYGEPLMKMLFPGHNIQLPERGSQYPKDFTNLKPPAERGLPDPEIDPAIAQAAQNNGPKRVPLNNPLQKA